MNNILAVCKFGFVKILHLMYFSIPLFCLSPSCFYFQWQNVLDIIGKALACNDIKYCSLTSAKKEAQVSFGFTISQLLHYYLNSQKYFEH